MLYDLDKKSVFKNIKTHIEIQNTPLTEDSLSSVLLKEKSPLNSSSAAALSKAEAPRGLSEEFRGDFSFNKAERTTGDLCF